MARVAITISDWVYDTLESQVKDNRSGMYEKYLVKGLATEGLINKELNGKKKEGDKGERNK